MRWLTAWKDKHFLLIKTYNYELVRKNVQEKEKRLQH